MLSLSTPEYAVRRDGEGHLVGDGESCVLEQLEADGSESRVATVQTSITMLPERRARPAPGGITQVASYSRRRGLPRRREIAARQDPCHDPAVARTEVDPARADRARATTDLDTIGNARPLAQSPADTRRLTIRPAVRARPVPVRAVLARERHQGSPRLGTVSPNDCPR
jgi:hypothetical protein